MEVTPLLTVGLTNVVLSLVEPDAPAAQRTALTLTPETSILFETAPFGAIYIQAGLSALECSDAETEIAGEIRPTICQTTRCLCNPPEAT
jgi:hypothetical protein